MGNLDNCISKIMAMETQLETYEESGTHNEQKKVLQILLVEVEKMKNEYLKEEDETYLEKIKRFLRFKIKEEENVLLSMIDELIFRIVEANRKVGNLYR